MSNRPTDIEPSPEAIAAQKAIEALIAAENPHESRSALDELFDGLTIAGVIQDAINKSISRSAS